MKIEVEVTSSEHGLLVPRRIRRADRSIDITEMVDQWFGVGYRYLKVIGADGHTYILRHDEETEEWDLTLFQRN
jgi:hypothetical protein